MSLAKVAATTGSLTVRITDTDGVLLAGSTYTLSGAASGSFTAATGADSFGSIAAGSITVTASKAGYVTNSATGTVVAGGSTTITVALAKVVASTGGLTVRITDVGGNLLPGATYILSGAASGSYTAVTGADVFSSVPTGTVTVTASKSGYQTNSASGTVTAGGSTTITVALAFSGNVPSISNDEPIAQPGNSISVNAGECVLASTTGVVVSTPVTYDVISVERYTATFWLLDRANAQRCISGLAYSGYLLNGAKGVFGLGTFTLPVGTWFAAVQDDRPRNASAPQNVAGVELARQTVGGFPGSTIGMQYVRKLNPGGWAALGLTIPAGSPVWFDGSSTGGTVVIMSVSAGASFISRYNGRSYDGGTYYYLQSTRGGVASDFCNLAPHTPDAPEDCDLTQALPPGSYYVVVINDGATPESFAGYTRVFTPSTSVDAQASLVPRMLRPASLIPGHHQAPKE